MRNSKFIKILYSVILVTLSFSVIIFATGADINISNADNHKSTYNANNESSFDSGIHVHNSTKTNKYLVRSGQTSYTVVISDGCSEVVLSAVNDLVAFIKKASGATLKIVYDSAFVSGNFISVGETKMFKNEHPDVSSLGANRSGYVIKSVNNNVFLYAHSYYGLSNAVYGFLEETIGFEVFAEDCIVYNENKDIPFYDYSVTEIPDIELRVANYGRAKETGDDTFARRTKMNLEKDVWLPIGTYYHNSFVILPPNVYKDAHPDWYYYGSEGGQLCYSNEELRKEFVERLKTYIIDNPGIENVTITQEDNHDWCQCSECKASNQKYGTNSAVVIKFINKVHDDIVKWMEEVGYDWEMNMAFFAYLPTVNAPCYEKDGKYYPIDDSVVCKDGVYVFYAPIEAVYSEDFYSVNNFNIYNNMMKWSAISKEMYLWTYSADFYHYLSPFDTYNSMQNIYKLAAKLGVRYIYDQAQMNNLNGTDFYNLKYYLNYKLQWNVNLDMNELIEDYFDAYFGKAAPDMMKYFKELRVRFQYIEQELGIKFFIYIETEKRDFWPLQLINQWLGYMENAKKAIAQLERTDKKAYETYMDRIGLESLSMRYLKIQLYSTTAFNEFSLLTEKKAFRKEATKYGITRYKEGGLVSELYTGWGLN